MQSSFVLPPSFSLLNEFVRAQPGRYSNARGFAECARCPVGYEASLPASGFCQPCTFSFFAGAEGTTHCDLCPVGSYSPAAASVCTLCKVSPPASQLASFTVCGVVPPC